MPGSCTIKEASLSPTMPRLQFFIGRMGASTVARPFHNRGYSVADDLVGQQRKVARALDFTRQFALAARAVARLAARLDLAGFRQIAAQRVHILIIEAFAVGAIDLPSAPARAGAFVAAFTTLAWLTGFGGFFTTLCGFFGSFGVCGLDFLISHRLFSSKLWSRRAAGGAAFAG